MGRETVTCGTVVAILIAAAIYSDSTFTAIVLSALATLCIRAHVMTMRTPGR